MGTIYVPNMGMVPILGTIAEISMHSFFFITMKLFFAGFAMDNKLRAKWSQQSLSAAVIAVVMGNCSKKSAAKIYGIPRGTLQRHVKKAEAGQGVEKRLGRACTLTPELEENLVTRILDMEARLYGLTKYDIRRIVYKFCEQNKVAHKFSPEKQLAGKKWMEGFMKRHKELANRIPEKTSLARAIGFNRSKVQLFFDILAKQLFDENGNRKIPPEQIFNVDETASPFVRRHRE
jgi:transposase